MSAYYTYRHIRHDYYYAILRAATDTPRSYKMRLDTNYEQL